MGRRWRGFVYVMALLDLGDFDQEFFQTLSGARGQNADNQPAHPQAAVAREGA